MVRRKVLADLETAVLECRGPLHHSWEYINPPPAARGTIAHMGDRVSMRCGRCQKEKHEVWSRTTGVLVYRAYKNPAGFATISRDVRVADLRKELLIRYKTTPATRKRTRRT